MKEQSKFSGTIRFVSSSPHGEVEGVVLEDGSFIKLPPHSILEVSQIKVGALVSGSGERLNLEPNAVFHHVLLKTGDLILANDQKGLLG
jgi:hypothetical protein